MIFPSDLPSIQRLAAELLSELEEGNLVILRCPANPTCERWLKAVLDAFKTVCQKAHTEPKELPFFCGQSNNPGEEVAKAFGFPQSSSAFTFLKSFTGEAVTILTVKGASDLSEGWKNLLWEFSRAYKDNTYSKRPMLVVLTECGQTPPISQNTVGTIVKEIWNVVRWEEIRLFVESRLTSQASYENALDRAWRIAVYSAASNGDPDLASHLCQAKPSSLSETIQKTLQEGGCGAETGEAPDVPSVPDQQWEVPSRVSDEWAKGWVSGITQDRGTVYNIQYMEPKVAKAYLLQAVWREQVAGLLPVLMDIGFSVNQAVTKELKQRNENWLNGLNVDEILGPDGRVFLEPADSINQLNNRWRVRKDSWDTLHLLKRARNDLAHMNPVDHPPIRKLGELYRQIQHEFLR